MVTQQCQANSALLLPPTALANSLTRAATTIPPAAKPGRERVAKRHAHRDWRRVGGIAHDEIAVVTGKQPRHRRGLSFCRGARVGTFATPTRVVVTRRG
jgi:hypothetical protein